MIYADYTYGADHRKRRGYQSMDNARKSAIGWCKAHKGEFVNFYKSKDSYKPIGQMVWHRGDDYPEYYRMYGCDDRYPNEGVSDGGYKVFPNGKVR